MRGGPEPVIALLCRAGQAPGDPHLAGLIGSPYIYIYPLFFSLTSPSYLQETTTLHDRRGQGLKQLPHSCIPANVAGSGKPVLF